MATVQTPTVADLLQSVNENTQTLAAILRTLQAQQAAQQSLVVAPKAPVPVQIQTSLPLPVAPATLVQAVVASQQYGVAQFLFLRYATAVPALGTAEVLYQVPPGYVLLIVGPFRLASDLHDPSLTATLTVDGIDVLYDTYPITADDSQELPQYGVIRRSLLAVYANGTTSPAVVTSTAGAVLLQASIYDGVILPLLKLGYGQLELYAENALGQGEVLA